jgi:hypothetical protein
MKRTFTALSIIGVLFIAPLAFAASANVEVDRDTAIFNLGDDQYIAGGNPVASTAISGDLFIAGGNVNVSTNIGRDLMAAGGDINMSGTVDDDVRIAGGTVRISGTVKGDVLVLGGTVSVAPDAIIEGNLAMFGGSMNMLGSVQKNVKIAGGDVRIAGKIMGNADIEAGKANLNGTIEGTSKVVAESITTGTDVVLLKNMEYWQKSGETDFSSAFKAHSGSATFKPELARKSSEPKQAAIVGAGLFGFIEIYSLLASAVIMVALLLLAPKSLRKAGEQMLQKPWASLLTGFLYYAATPVLVILLCISIIGIPLGIIVLITYIFTLLFAKIISSLVIARAMEKQYKWQWNNYVYILVSLLIYVALKAVLVIPILGFVIHIGFVCMAIGAMLASIWSNKKAF